MNEEIMRRYRHRDYQADVEDFCRRHGSERAAELVTASGENPFCGDSLSIALSVADGVIRDACYDGYGCSLCIASAEALLESIIGKPVQEAVSADAENLVRALGGIKVGKSRMKCVELPLTVMRRAVS